MATIAASNSGTRGSAKAPISTHPAFPAIVALWFAALLGLGSLVLPVALLERLVTVTGIAALLPSAAPPLGFTARIVIALTGAIGGATLGLLLARQVARAHAPEPRGRHFDFDAGRPRRPFSAHDELAEEGLAPSMAGQPLLAQKRRSLAMTEDNRRSTYLPAVPLPGQSEDAAHDLPAPTEAAPEPAPDPAASAEPLELGAFADATLELEEAEATEEVTAPDPALEALRSQIHVPADLSPEDEHVVRDRQEFQPAPARARDADDPLPFAPPSLRRAEPAPFDEDYVDDEEAYEEDMDEPQDLPSRDDEAVPHLSLIESTEDPAQVDDDRPLEELGLVQLAARLGASLARRKARAAAAPAVHAAPAAYAAPLTAAEDFEVAQADDAARAIADFFGPAAPAATPAESAQPAAAPKAFAQPAEAPEPAAPAVPASMRALSFEHDEVDDEEALEASFSLPLSKAAAAAETFDEYQDDEADFSAESDAEAGADEEVEAEDEDDGEYSSLLAMKNPFARPQEFVRVEEPEDERDIVEPTVTFPTAPTAPAAPAGFGDRADAAVRPFDPPAKAGESAVRAASAARQDPSDAERNLRAALATLQRMSGAA